MMNIFTSLLSQPVEPKPEKQQRRGIEIKSPREIEIMRQSAKIVATVLKEISELVQPGMTTADLDAYAEKRIREMDATPSFKGYHGFPASICSSINNEVVHGIPSPKKIIRSGDVLKVDTGIDVRTIVSGIAEHFSPEEVVGKRVTVLVNLAPRALRGVESQGMILMTNNVEGKLIFVNPSADGVQNGASIL